MHNKILFLLSLTTIFVSACSNSAPAEKDDNASGGLNFADETTQKIINAIDKRDAKSLYKHFYNTEPILRLLAVNGMASVQDTSRASVDSLAAVLANDKNAQVREAAAFALGMGNAAAAAKLTARFQPEKNSTVRAAILEAMGKVGTAEALAQIATVKTYETKDSALVTGQARCIFRFAGRNILLPAATKLMAEMVTNTAYPEKARTTAAYFFNRTKSIPMKEYEDTLCKTILKEQNASVRAFIAPALARTQTKLSLETLAALLQKETNWQVKTTTLRSLNNFGTKLAQTQWQTALDDANVNVAATAAEQLQKYGDPKALYFYKQKANAEKRWQVATPLYAAALAITSIKNRPALDSLSAQLKTRYEASKNDYERAALMQAMTGFGVNYTFIQQELQADNSPSIIRVAALEAIAKIRAAKTYRLTFGKNLKQTTRTIDSVLTVAATSGDVGLVATAADALRDSTADFRQFIPVATLQEGLKKLKMPRDFEGIVALQKTINYFSGKRLDDGITKIEYQHAIDYTALAEMKGSQARISTTKGEIVVQLFMSLAPGSVGNFAKLAGADFFNGKFFHRVVPVFVAQGGCPRGDGYGAQDFTIRTEIPYKYHYDEAGYLGMASAGKDSEGTQWFITQNAAPHLDGRYTIFGKVIRGLDVVQKLELGDKMIAVKIL